MKNLSLILTKYSKWFLVLAFIFAIILRWLYLPQKAISFAYDQGRDAFVVQEILQGNLKILGPPVSGVPGLFHGVLYYYVIAPAYLLGHGDPVAVAYFLSFVSSLVVFLVYLLAKVITKEKVPSLIAAFIFAFSFEASQYANLMTNASMGVWFVPILYIGLYLWINKSTKWAPLITGAAFGLSIQSEIALAYHLVPILIWLYIFRKNINKKQIVIFTASFLITLFSLIISEIKFGFTGLSGIIYLLSGGDGIVKSKNLSDYFVTLLNQSGKTFAYSLFPVSVVFGGITGFVLIVSSVFFNHKEILKKILTWETFLISYIFAYAFALPFGGWNMRHILVGVAPAIAVFAGIFIWKYLSKNNIMLVCFLFVILLSNLFMIIKENNNGQTIFPLQPDLILRNEIGVIDYTYINSHGNEFSISSLTSPLFVNTLWSYLYNWYGQSKYGYLPSWMGRDQVGQLGNNLKLATSDLSGHFFLIPHYYIIEPTFGIPELYVGYARGDQEAVSSYVDKISFGQLIVEKRQIKNEKK